MSAVLNNGLNDKFVLTFLLSLCCGICLLSLSDSRLVADESNLLDKDLLGKDKPLVATKAYMEFDKLPAGETCKVLLVVNVKKGWHINSNPPEPDFLIPTKFTLKSKQKVTLTEVKYPKSKGITIDGFGEKIQVYEGEFAIWGTLTIPKSASGTSDTLEMTLQYQACDDKKCLPPAKVKLDGKIAVAKPDEKVNKVNTSLFKKYAASASKSDKKE